MNSKIPKLSFAELPNSIANLLRSKYQRLGYLGEFFARTAHQEEALVAFIQFTDAAKGALDFRLVELIALTIATRQEIAYEKNQHERLCIKLGYGRDWVAEVETLGTHGNTLMSTAECLVQQFVLHAVHNNGRGSSQLLNQIVDQFGHEDAVAIQMVMARYVAHALLINCMDIAAPVPSIFENGFGLKPSD